MKELKEYLREELVVANIDADDEFACIEQLGKLLHKNGYVKDTYTQAVKDREKIYPTGLFTNEFGVAIPHTDALHVNEAAVAIGTLKKPVEFNLMGGGEKVLVSIVFQLAISSPQEQVHMLQSLVGLFTDDKLLRDLNLANEPEEIICLIHDALSLKGA